MTAVTDPLSAPPPVDPDDPRHAIARAKGLEQPVITGGEDPDPGLPSRSTATTASCSWRWS